MLGFVKDIKMVIIQCLFRELSYKPKIAKQVKII